MADYPILKFHDQVRPIGIIRLEKEYADKIANMSFNGFDIVLELQAKYNDGKYEMLSVSLFPKKLTSKPKKKTP